MVPRSPEVIVVGVDGSPGSVEALRWAVRQARATAGVHAVAAWEIPTTFGYAPPYDDIDWAAEAQKTLETALNEVTDGAEPVAVTAQVVRGHAGTVLVEASRNADLLVVGSRGHGTAVGMLLGSVSEYCVHHAECPVVVVRPRRR